MKSVHKLKSDKANEDGMLLSDNFINGSDLLFVYMSLLFTVMISHSFAPPDLILSSIILIPKGSRVSLSDSDKYRSIAISSLLSKILDYIIIEYQSKYLNTSDYQYGFKQKSSTVLCTTMVNETIQYYSVNGAKPVYLLLLDASKAFDKVSFCMLFNMLLDKNICPRTIKLLYYMYTNQSCYVTWSNERSRTFSVSNGVKQGAVISPLLFSIYIDNLFLELQSCGLGCHVGLTYAGAFGYADDIALVAPSMYSLKKMITICEDYANIHSITFNPNKSKLICFNTGSCHIAAIYLNGHQITMTKQDKHLGNYISNDIYDRHLCNTVCDFYQRSHGIINDFRSCDSITLDNLHRTYCMHMYGCELWNLNDKNIDAFRIAWRKIKRRIWKIPIRAHNQIVENLSYNFDACLDLRIVKFLYNSLNHDNNVCRIIVQTKINCVRSTLSDNYHYLSYKYQLSNLDWCNGLDYLLGKVKFKQCDIYTVSPQARIVVELCSIRDNLAICPTLDNREICKLIEAICTD